MDTFCQISFSIAANFSFSGGVQNETASPFFPALAVLHIL
jgi:hypothetical protein